MRIAMVAYSTYLVDPRVRREAEALVDAGHEVDVICTRNEGEIFRELVNGVRIHRIPVKHRRANPLVYIFDYIAFFLLATFYLAAMHLKYRYRLVHVHNMPNFLVFTGLLPRLAGARVILDMHDPMPEIYQSHFDVAADHWLVRLLGLEERISCRFADYLITVNEPMRELILRKGLNSKPVEVVMNLPDPRIFATSEIEGRRSGNKRDGFELIYTGLVSQRNGLDIAIEALRRLREEMPDLRLTIIGGGTQLDELKEMVKRYDLAGKVTFKKPVRVDEIPGILANCDAGISPHRDNSFTRLMFSTKVAEYMSLELPVILARTHTMERYYDDSTLFFFEPGNPEDLADQIRLIRQRPELVAARKMAGKKRMHQLNWNEEKVRFLGMITDWGGENGPGTRNGVENQRRDQ